MLFAPTVLSQFEEIEESITMESQMSVSAVSSQSYKESEGVEDQVLLGADEEQQYIRCWVSDDLISQLAPTKQTLAFNNKIKQIFGMVKSYAPNLANLYLKKLDENLE